MLSRPNSRPWTSRAKLGLWAPARGGAELLPQQRPCRQTAVRRQVGIPIFQQKFSASPCMYSAAVQALCCEGVRRGFSLPSKNKNPLGRHYGKAGHQEPGVIRGHRVLCVIQEGFLAKGAVELPSENRQGSGLGEGIGLRA